MALLTAADISIGGSLPVETLLDLRIEGNVNHHAVLTYRGYVDNSNIADLLADKADDLVDVQLAGSVGFIGIPVDYFISTENHVNTLHVTCLSTSAAEDVQAHKQSFQSYRYTPAKIVEQSFGRQNGVVLLGQNLEAHKIKAPVFQYIETNWELAKRMAGDMDTVIVANHCSKEPQISIGFPGGKNHQHEGSRYFYGKLRKLCNDGEERTFHYFDIECDARLSVGDNVSFRGRQHKVVGFTYSLQDGVLRQMYRIAQPEAYSILAYKNERQCGLSLIGTISESTGETVSIELDMDEAREPSNTHDYAYTPVQGNVMYSMPEVGSRGYLRVGAHDGGKCVVEHAMRVNGGSGNTADPSSFYYKAQSGEELAMLPDRVTLTAGGSSMLLGDSEGISLRTGGAVLIEANGEVRLNSSGAININTPEQVNVGKSGTKTGIEISGGQMHVKGENVNIQGSPTAKETSPPAFEKGENVTVPLGVANKLDGMQPAMSSASVAGSISNNTIASATFKTGSSISGSGSLSAGQPNLTGKTYSSSTNFSSGINSSSGKVAAANSMVKENAVSSGYTSSVKQAAASATAVATTGKTTSSNLMAKGNTSSSSYVAASNLLHTPSNNASSMLKTTPEAADILLKSMNIKEG